MNERTSVDELRPAIERAQLEVDEVRALCEAVLERPLYWFPIRHHSPGCARFLKLALKARKPRIVFIEGPSEADPLIPHVVDAKTRPPVALYSAFRDDASVLESAGVERPTADVPIRLASWFPLMSYSPEYVAMVTAWSLGAEVQFIDLPHFALAGNLAAGPPTRMVERESDRLITASLFFQELTRASRYRSWDEAWETLFEVRDFKDPEHFRREMALFCAAARASVCSDLQRQHGTRERERFMRQTIERSLHDRAVSPCDAVVVSGGFHMYLDETDRTPPPPVPSGSLYTTLVPFSYARVCALSGYAAGNRAPQFYERLWESSRGRGVPDVSTAHCIEVIREARRYGEVLSSADAISTAHTAELLARLRRREAPVLDDINDALLTCCCKGDPEQVGHHLLKAMAVVSCGSRVGKVTRAVRRLPLAEDFHVQLGHLGLGQLEESDRVMDLTLDLRTPLGSRRSAFLHQLRLLEVAVGRLDAPSPLSAQLFGESWSLRWTPGIEAALVERSAYGDTVETAAVAVLNEKVHEARAEADRVCRLMLAAIHLDIADLIPELTRACRASIDQDNRFVALAAALGSLRELRRHLALRNLSNGFAVDLVLRCFDRACLAVGDAIAAPADLHEAVLESLLIVAGTLVEEDSPGLDRRLFAVQVRQAADATRVPFLRGAFLGVLCELHEVDVTVLASELEALSLAPAEVMATAGEFLEGVMAASKASILLGAETIVAAIDRLLLAAEWNAFLTMLPRLRAAFERLGSRARHVFASTVARRYGLGQQEGLERLPRLQNSVAMRLDEELAQIMKEWDL